MTNGANSQVKRKLSAKEKRILELIAQGFTRPAIAEIVGIAEGTVDGHMKRIFNAVGAHCASQAVAMAIARGEILVDVEIGEALSDRHQKILIGLAQGLSNPQIAASIDRCKQTLNREFSDLYTALKAGTRPHLVYLGFKTGNLTVNRREKK